MSLKKEKQHLENQKKNIIHAAAGSIKSDVEAMLLNKNKYPSAKSISSLDCNINFLPGKIANSPLMPYKRERQQVEDDISWQFNYPSSKT